MPKVDQASPTQAVCTARDTTPPPPPRVIVCKAFDRGTDEAEVLPNPRPPRPVAAPIRDPAYIELGDVEVGSRIQILNLSKKPDADFGTKADVVELPLTGRDVRQRQASIYLNDEQMTKLGLEPGDMIKIRAVDHSGIPSTGVVAELEPNSWANQRIRDREGDELVVSRGRQFDALDGEGDRRAIIAKAVQDTRPPVLVADNTKLRMVDNFSDTERTRASELNSGWSALARAVSGGSFNTLERITAAELNQLARDTDNGLSDELRTAMRSLARSNVFEKVAVARRPPFEAAPQKSDQELTITLDDVRAAARSKPGVFLTLDRALEPGATVEVVNQRTGQAFSGEMPDGRVLHLDLGEVKDGDVLILTPTDNNGVEGKMAELVYSSKCKDGKAPSVKGGIATRLAGVLGGD